MSTRLARLSFNRLLALALAFLVPVVATAQATAPVPTGEKAARTPQIDLLSAEKCEREILKETRHDDFQPTPISLEMSDGRHYRLLGQDFIDPELWVAGDKLLVCEEAGKVRSSKIMNVERHEILVGLPITPLPMDERAAAQLVIQIAADQRSGGNANANANAKSNNVRLEGQDGQNFSFSVHSASGCLPGQPVCSTLIGHFRVDKEHGTIFDADRHPD